MPTSSVFGLSEDPRQGEWTLQVAQVLGRSGECCKLDAVSIEVGVEWEVAGSPDLSGSAIIMPELPGGPGVYQWVFDDGTKERRYVGEAANLRSRFAQYAKPGPTQKTNVRMRDRLVRVVSNGGLATILVAEQARLIVGGQQYRADMSSQFVRRLIENATLVELLTQGSYIANDRGYGPADRLAPASAEVAPMADQGHGPMPEAMAAGPSVAFWVYENWTHDRARIHRADCGYCNAGEGMHGDTTDANGHWLPYEDYEYARRSKAMQRRDARDCAVCDPASTTNPSDPTTGDHELR